MPAIYRDHDVFIFSSVWEEPFALTMLEVMACGVPIVGTVTGGSAEILDHEVTGLVYEAGEPESLAAQLKRMLDEPALRRTVARNALQRVRTDFSIERTVDRVEAFLVERCSKPAAS
jgi:glycosyltransferase involved in cell wall biosynthesis